MAGRRPPRYSSFSGGKRSRDLYLCWHEATSLIDDTRRNFYGNKLNFLIFELSTPSKSISDLVRRPHQGGRWLDLSIMGLPLVDPGRIRYLDRWRVAENALRGFQLDCCNVLRSLKPNWCMGFLRRRVPAKLLVFSYVCDEALDLLRDPWTSDSYERRGIG